MAKEVIYTKAMASECAARGVEFLDKRKPGWRSRVDRYILDMMNCKLCMLGQVFGGYRRGLVLCLILSYNRRVQLGFTLPANISGRRDEAWNALTAAWLEILGPKEETATATA